MVNGYMGSMGDSSMGSSHKGSPRCRPFRVTTKGSRVSSGNAADSSPSYTFAIGAVALVVVAALVLVAVRRRRFGIRLDNDTSDHSHQNNRAFEQLSASTHPATSSSGHLDDLPHPLLIQIYLENTRFAVDTEGSQTLLWANICGKSTPRHRPDAITIFSHCPCCKTERSKKWAGFFSVQHKNRHGKSESEKDTLLINSDRPEK